jgi:hypothetical protein
VFLLKCSRSIWQSYKKRNVFKITIMCIGLRCSSPLPNRIVQSAGRPVRSSKVQYPRYSFDFVSVSLHSELAVKMIPINPSPLRAGGIYPKFGTTVLPIGRSCTAVPFRPLPTVLPSGSPQPQVDDMKSWDSENCREKPMQAVEASAIDGLCCDDSVYLLVF